MILILIIIFFYNIIVILNIIMCCYFLRFCNYYSVRIDRTLLCVSNRSACSGSLRSFTLCLKYPRFIGLQSFHQ